MIKFLKHNEIDEQKWNKCILNAQKPLPYACTWYLNTMCENWNALVLNEYEAVMPLPTKTKYGINYIYQPFVTPQLGIFAAKYLEFEQIQLQFEKAIPSKFKFFNYVVNFKSKKGVSTPKPNFEIDLSYAYQKLLKSYKYNTRHSIVKADVLDNNFVRNLEPQKIIDFFKNTSGANLNYSNAQYSKFEKLLEQSIENNVGHSISFVSEGEIDAVVFYLKYGNRIINLLNASSSFARKNNLMAILINEIIKENSGQEGLIFDFEGSAIPSIAKFFKGFGAVDQPIYYWKWNRLPFPINLLKR